jgi:gentisate 1,2-dioxygenase
MSDVVIDDLAAIRRAPDLPSLYRHADDSGLTPGWVPRDIPILWREPTPRLRAAHWRFDAARAALDAAGRLIDVALAERRNLLMRNPQRGTNFATVNTLVCAYQMILPGESAPSHRHAPHALRVILDAKRSYSVVNGEKVPMETGDVVLTPGWHWHAHGHDGDEPAYWLDVLDVPLVHLLEPMFYEEHPEGLEPNVREVAETPFRFPKDWIARELEAASADPDGVAGRKIVLPAPSMPTMEISMQRLDRGHSTRNSRTTANQIFCVVAGEGVTDVDGKQFSWRTGDTVAVPAWTWYRHRATTEATLFSASDEPLMRWANYARREIAA